MDPISLVWSEFANTSNPHLSKETIVLRLVRRLVDDTFQMSWFDVLETIRQGLCHLTTELHNIIRELNRMYPDEFMERIMAKDYARPSDILKLAGILSKHSQNKLVNQLFAVDKSLGDDLKRYADNLKWTNEDYKQRHVEGIRAMYENGCNSPDDVAKNLDLIFEGKETTTHPAQISYLAIAQGFLEEIKEWKKAQQKTSETKKKSSGVKRKRGESTKKKETAVPTPVEEESSHDCGESKPTETSPSFENILECKLTEGE